MEQIVFVHDLFLNFGDDDCFLDWDWALPQGLNVDVSEIEFRK
jgi:hypothetical protein